MSQVQKLRVFASQRLNVALEEILEAFEKTILKYEEEAALNREVISRQHALLCALNNPIIKDAPTAGVFTQQLLFSKDDVSLNHQNLSQDLVSEPSHVKEKREEQVQDLDEAEIIEFTYNSKNAKNPCDNFQTLAELRSVVPTQHGSIVLSTETEDSVDYSNDFADANPAPDQTGLCRQKDGFSCQSCNRTFTARRFLFKHVRVHIQDTKICGLCGEQFEVADDLKIHLQTHSRTRKLQIQVRTRSREMRLQQLSELNQNKITEKPDDSNKTPEKKRLRGRPKKNKPNEDDPGKNKKRKRRI